MTCDPLALANAANCFACLTPRQLQLVNTQLLCQLLTAKNPMASCDPQSLMNSANCLSCLSPFQLALIQTQLLCELVQAGGAGGGSCLLCGVTPPTAATACPCALYYNSATGNLYYWDATNAVWVPLIV